MRKIFISEEIKKLIGYEVGSRLHEEWRESRNVDEQTRLGREPRWKKTKDQMFIAQAKESEVVRIGEVVEVDIANMTFTELPEDWQKENLEAGLAATRLTMGTLSKEGSISLEEIISLSVEEVEKLGDGVHEAWMQRTEKADWNAEQFVPYSELPRSEQEKDLLHVRMVVSVIKEVLTGEITLEELRAKYGEMIKTKQEQH